MRIITLHTLAIIALIVSKGQSCTCVISTPLQTHYDLAMQVVEGTVISKETVYPEIGGWFEVQLEITENLKGTAENNALKIYTNTDPASCGFPIEVGKSYVVFSNIFSESELEGKQITNLCSGNFEMDAANAGEKLDSLREIGGSSIVSKTIISSSEISSKEFYRIDGKKKSKFHENRNKYRTHLVPSQSTK